MPRKPERNNSPKSIIIVVLILILTAGSTGCSDEECVCPEPGDPPRITGHYPADGDTLVKPDSFLTVTFDMEMDPATVSAGSFTLEGTHGQIVASVSLDGAAATLTPYETLTGHSIYTTHIDAGVSSIAGTAMGVDYAWSFTTDTSSLLLRPDIEFTVRDSDGDGSPDSIYGNGPPGRHLHSGDLGAVEDRAIMEFPLDEIVKNEVLGAIVILTLFEVTSETTPVRIEAWGYSGDGSAGLTDWSCGQLMVGYDLTHIRSGNTYAFHIKDAINTALAEGATHAGFRMVLTGGPHTQIYTMEGLENDKPRLVIQQ